MASALVSDRNIAKIKTFCFNVWYMLLKLTCEENHWYENVVILMEVISQAGIKGRDN